MKDTLQWGILGTGAIASDFVEALGHSTQCRVVSVAGTSPQKARAFAEKWSLPKSAGSRDELLADKEVEAVYIAAPHPAHEEHALACIEAGIAVLCEKPIALDAASAARVIEAARSRGVFLMEAFMYRCHPLIVELLSRLRAGIIGPIHHVRSDFGFRVPRDPSSRLFDPKLGGGGILDVGGYPVSFVRLIAGLVEGAPFAEPVKFQGCGRIGPHGADEMASAFMTFASGFTASVTSAVFADIGTTTVVFGEGGKIVLSNPWLPGGQRQGLESSFTVYRDGREPETITIRTDKPIYAIEAEFVANTLPKLEATSPGMSWADTLGNMRVLDAWQAALR